MALQNFSHPELIKKLPEEVKIIFKIFGDEIRLVGGSLRDLLLKKNVNDFDFTTKFLPPEIIKILGKNKIKAIPTGVKFGTITAVVNGKNFEITTLRKDAETDGRHCTPEFVSDYFLDAARRDFTVNALYLDSKGVVTDYFDGISDLKNKKVRFIGEAKKRIEEDYLRILRFFRFSCEYAAELDVQGLEACVAAKENLIKLSRERVRAEILKMIASAKKENLLAVLRVLKSKKIAQVLFHSPLDVEALERLFELEKKFKFTAERNLKMAVLFLAEKIDLKVFAGEICATNLEKKYFSYVLGASDGLGLGDLRQLLLFNEKDWVRDFYLFSLIKNPNSEKTAEIKKNLQYLQNFSLPNFPITGEDVLQLGFKGKAAGEAILSAKKFWAANDFLPEKLELLKFLGKYFEDKL